MKILMDGQPLLGVKSGIGRYTETLYRALTEHFGVDVTLSFNRILKTPELDPTAYPQWINHRYPYKLIRRIFRPNPLYNWPADACSRIRYDVYHGTNFTHLPLTKGKVIVTIHDLSFLLFPEYTSDIIYKHHSRWVPFSAKVSDHIIADSEQTKMDIVRLLGISPDKISVVHLAADERFAPLPESEYLPVIKKYNLPSKYILFVGNIEPRKNLPGLIRAFRAIKNSVEEKLVVVGAKAWKSTPIFELVRELELMDDVHFAGYVDDADLPAIFNGASVLVLPSFYEGYGLPIIEAMRCGVPVIGSNVSAIPEIIGDAGFLIDPHNAEELSDAVKQMIKSPSVRRHYSQLALQRAAHFSWKKTAQQTLEVYKKVV
jgi:glycosyltransferase involved in cell wall biosynthesis